MYSQLVYFPGRDVTPSIKVMHAGISLFSKIDGERNSSNMPFDLALPVLAVYITSLWGLVLCLILLGRHDDKNKYADL